MGGAVLNPVIYIARHSLHSAPSSSLVLPRPPSSHPPAADQRDTMASDLPASSLREPIELVEYLYTRLYQVGIRGVHGVPGDYSELSLPRPVRHRVHRRQISLPWTTCRNVGSIGSATLMS